MSELADRSLVTACRFFPQAAGTIAAFVGVLVLAGWFIGSDALKTAVPGGTPMGANAAVCFFLCGVALWLTGGKRGGVARRIGQAWAMLAGLIGLASLAQHFLGMDLGIEQFLLREMPAPGVAQPGPMPPLAAAGFVLASCALLLLDAETRRGRRPAQLLALPVGLIAFCGTVYYVPDLKGSATGMSLHGALLFGLLSLGVLLARPGEGVTGILASPRVGRTLMRRLAPCCVAALGVVAWLRWMGQGAGPYRTELGIILMVSGAAAVILFLIWMNADALDRADQKRRWAKENEAYDRSFIEASPDPLVAIDADGRIGDVNRATELATGFSRKELVGKELSDYFTEPQRVRAGYQQAFQTGQVLDCLLLRRRDGHTAQTTASGSASTTSSRRPTPPWPSSRRRPGDKPGRTSIRGQPAVG
jgi:PAS domain S-box-containing protein